MSAAEDAIQAAKNKGTWEELAKPVPTSELIHGLREHIRFAREPDPECPVTNLILTIDPDKLELLLDYAERLQKQVTAMEQCYLQADAKLRREIEISACLAGQAQKAERTVAELREELAALRKDGYMWVHPETLAKQIQDAIVEWLYTAGGKT